MNISKYIVLDIMESWPKEVKEILEENKDELIKFSDSKHDIDILRAKFPISRSNYFEIEFQEVYDDVFDYINEIMSGKNVIGFHCSRLIESEIEIIKKEGLKPLTGNLTEMKLKMIKKDNLLDAKIIKKLKENNKSDVQGRMNKIFFIHCINNLIEFAIDHPLFRFWGGETFHFENKYDNEIAKQLQTIGEPYIIVSNIPYRKVNYKTNYGKRMIDWYIKQFKDKHFFSDIENNFTTTIKADKIININKTLNRDLNNIRKELGF